MPTGQGSKSYISLKEETAWGTFLAAPAARDSFARIVRDELDTNLNYFQLPGLGTRTVTDMMDGTKEAGGAEEVEVGFEGMLPYFLKHVLGGYDFQIDTPVAGANSHVFSSKPDLPQGLSLELGVGGVPGADKVVRYPGGLVSAMELSLQNNDVLRCALQLVTKDEDTNGTLGHTQLAPPVFPNIRPVKFWYHTTLSIAGSGVTKCRNWRMRFDNDLQRAFNLTKLTDRPLPGAKRSVICEGQMQLESFDHWDKYAKGTSGAFALIMNSGTDQVVTGAQPYTLTIVGTNSKITGSRPKVTDAGIILMPFTAQLFDPAGGSEVTVTLVNGQATVGAEIL